MGFESFSLQQIPRSKNTYADPFATLTTSLMQSLPQVILIKDLYKPSEMREKRILIHQTRVGPNWMDPIVLFLKNDILPEEKGEIDKVQRRAHWF